MKCVRVNYKKRQAAALSKYSFTFFSSVKIMKRNGRALRARNVSVVNLQRGFYVVFIYI